MGEARGGVGGVRGGEGKGVEKCWRVVRELRRWGENAADLI